MSASNYVHVAIDYIKAETDKAFLVVIDYIKAETDKAFLVVIDGEEVWLPKSQIADPDDYSEGDEDIEISITEWLAGQKGLL